MPRVAQATVDRVLAAARRHGYRRNPIAGAIMSEIRRSRSAHYRGTLGLLELAEPQRPPGAREFYASLCVGAHDRAVALGFTVDRFLIGREHLRPERLNAVLAARSIAGVLVLPSFMDAHLEAIAWDQLAGVYLDRVINFPPMHSVSTDHHGAIWAALGEAERAGYRRAGLILQSRQDERLQNRWEGAFRAYEQRATSLALAPPLVAPEITEAAFRAWFRRHRPDLVLAHSTRCLDWMERLGARVPGTHGFLALNATMCDRACAAIDQQPALIGAHGAALLIGQILRGESGLPANPCNTSVPARIRRGPTMRTEGNA